MRAIYPEDYKVIALCRWIGFIPTLFVFYCCLKKKELIQFYKTSIIFAAFGQFVMSQPIALYFVFLSFFTGRDIPSTALICTLTHNGATVTEFSAHLVIPTVAIGRFLGVVVGLKLNVYALIAVLAVITAPHFAALYISIFDGVPVPYLDCSPLLFFADESIRQPYNYYMYFPPIIAVAFNLGTLGYVYWHKSQRGTQVSTAKARDELMITLGLLTQSIVPAITISSRAYFMWIDIFLIEVPKILENIVEYTSYFTVGLNTMASIIFIKPFRNELKRIIRMPFNRGYNPEASAFLGENKRPGTTNRKSTHTSRSRSGVLPSLTTLTSLCSNIGTCAANFLRTTKTSIIFAAFGQLSQPIALYFIFLSFFTGKDIPSTALICTITHNSVHAIEFGAHLVIPTVAIGRFIGLVIGFKLNVYALTAVLLIVTAPHLAALYLTIINGVPIPYLDCSPVLFFSDRSLRPLYNYYMYVPPIIALAFNLGTLSYVFWHKAQRAPASQTSAARAKEEILVTLGLFAQSVIPAITISSRAYFMWIQIFLIQVPQALQTGVEYLSYFTVGLNTLASIAFIKPFREELLKIVRRPFARANASETSVVTVQFRSV